MHYAKDRVALHIGITNTVGSAIASIACTYLLQALHYAKDRGALCIGITNTVGSAIARHTDCGVHINAGCEIGVASTKAYTSQMVVITMMALALSEDSIAKRPKRDAVIDALGSLPAKLRRVSGFSVSAA